MKAGLCLLAGACVLLLALLARALLVLRRERAENRRLRELTTLLSRNGEDEQLQRLRHDLRHYLLAGGQLPEGLSQESLQGGTGPNAPVETLVEHYREQALALGAQVDIRLDIDGCEDQLLPELYLVISNLLENAVEALQREKGGWVRARCTCTEGYISLVVGNRCGSPPRTWKGRYLSSKAEGRLGLGLSIVEDIARRRGGEARFDTGEGQFLASVFLPREVQESSEPGRDAVGAV